MEAVKYLKKLGMENVELHEKKLVEYCFKKMSELSKLKLYGPRELKVKSGIIPFNLIGHGSHEVAMILDHFGIMVRSGLHCAQPLHQVLEAKATVRASFYIYNTFEEIDRMIEVLTELEKD